VNPDLAPNAIPEETKALLDEGRWQEAVASLDAALASSPHQMPLLREKANTLIALDQPQEALACYERMLDLAPFDPSLHAEKAVILESLDRDDEALASYDHALTLANANETLLHAKAQLLTRLNRIPEAIAAYDELLSLNPQNPQFLIAKGDALLIAGQIEQIDLAARYFRQAAGISPSSFGAAEWASRGDTLLGQGQPQQALKFYENAIQVDLSCSWAYRGKGLALKETSDQMPEKIEEVLRCFDRAIEFDPKSARLLVEKGNIYYEMRQYKAAADCYTKATELDPKSEVAWGNLCLSQEELADYSQALVSAEKRLAIDPNSVDALVHKGFCLDRLKRLDESTATYQKALELGPEDFGANNNMGWNLRQMQKYKEALPYFEKAIGANPKEDTPWLNKARNLLQLGFPRDALNTLHQALDAVSSKRDVLATMGFIHTESLYEHDKALPYYQQCLQHDPTDVTIRAAIAECLIKMGRYKQGRTEAEQLLGQMGNQDLESSVGLVILASYALEGDLAGRVRQFDAVLEHFGNKSSRKVDPNEEAAWVFNGLLEAIRSSTMSRESKFLVLTAIDVQERRIDQNKLSFFTAAHSQISEPSSDP